MKKLSKGAFSMVLAGAVTFSVTNALLVDQASKLLAGEHAFIISGDLKKAVETNEKTEKDHTPTTNVKETKPSENIVALKRQKENEDAKAAIDQNKNNYTNGPVARPVHENTSTTATPTATKPATSTKAPMSATASAAKTASAATTTPTKSTVPSTTATNKTSAAGTTANNGQEVSQAAKEKAAVRQDTKENNGKKM